MRIKLVSPNLVAFLFILVLFMVCLEPVGQATTNPEDTKAQKQDVKPMDGGGTDTFNYVLEGRPDPFMPFIEPQVATKVSPEELEEENMHLSGMQLFEPGQLRLVALMFSGGKKIAMVQDVTGRGYVINEGTLIGRHGVVSQIKEDEVIITETAHTRAGKELVSTVVMRLNKEGDK